MATATIRPVVGGTNAWITTPASQFAYDMLDDVVTDPTAPSTASDFISTSTTTAVADQVLADPSLPAGRTINSIVAHVYCATTGVRRTLTIELYYLLGGSGAATSLGTTVVPASSAAAWKTVTASSTGLSDAELNSLRVKLTATVSSSTSTGTATAYAAYVDIDYAVAASLPTLPRTQQRVHLINR